MVYKSNIPYLGFPGLTYNELIAFGTRGMGNLEEMKRLEKIYAFIKAFLVVREDKDNGNEIVKKMEDIAQRLQDLTVLYQPSFEGEATFSDLEKSFVMACWGIFEEETQVIALAKMIEKIRPEKLDVPTGDE
jgi:hypothetical protein